MKEIMTFEELCNTANIEMTLMSSRCENLAKEIDKLLDGIHNEKLAILTGKYSTDTISREDLLEMKRVLIFLANGKHLVSMVRDDG